MDSVFVLKKSSSFAICVDIIICVQSTQPRTLGNPIKKKCLYYNACILIHVHIMLGVKPRFLSIADLQVFLYAVRFSIIINILPLSE